ncbi:uncharacterized protein LOC101858201 isoform X2 [Aplysia californica]|uniref:Uncharacterized protein LOC101858201 isoform X2 n=1 Tax=Aplysia californica TaxID=6500 RepID=A0ABM0JX45_APLCA|nr:uncharacterized protein LOC101858201 isoform X2 [Aplysia californica]XP_005103624.1 uncharacterized protein LOC101858201 isoform X2 [Aplysia californica]XP_035827008.1 uncharacterized protein LOC101858201 isoform X2 [Aplysia californica]
MSENTGESNAGQPSTSSASSSTSSPVSGAGLAVVTPGGGAGVSSAEGQSNTTPAAGDGASASPVSTQPPERAYGPASFSTKGKTEDEYFRVLYNYKALPGDVITVEKVYTEDRSKFFIQFLVMRETEDHILERSEAIPIKEDDMITIVDPQRVRQKIRGKYRIKLKKNDRNLDLKKYYQQKRHG